MTSTVSPRVQNSQPDSFRALVSGLGTNGNDRSAAEDPKCSSSDLLSYRSINTWRSIVRTIGTFVKNNVVVGDEPLQIMLTMRIWPDLIGADSPNPVTDGSLNLMQCS